MRCLVVFRYRMVEFRVAELQALVEMQGYTFVRPSGVDVRAVPEVDVLREVPDGADPSRVVILEGPAGGEPFSPFWLLHSPDEAVMRGVCARSVLVRAVLELWAEGPTWEDVVESLRRDAGPAWTTGLMGKDETFKFRVEHFGAPLPATEHPPLMLSLRWLGEQWRGRVDLRDAQHVMWITKCERGDNMGLPETIPTRWFFGRQVAIADKCFWQGFALPQRGYIGTTSMDPEMAFVMANMGQVRASQLVMDPFAGTGSILVSLVYFGAHVIGMDMDVRVIRDGADRGGQHRDIWSNFQQYGLAAPVGLFCDDFSRWSLRGDAVELLDAVVCDPPYGVREGGRKSHAKAVVIPDERRGAHIPSTARYRLSECLADLLLKASALLRVGGRLVFFMPWFEQGEGEELALLARHPCLALRAVSEQVLQARYNRRLVTMQKARPFDGPACEAHARAMRAAHMTVDAIHAWVFKAREEGGGGCDRPRFRCKDI